MAINRFLFAPHTVKVNKVVASEWRKLVLYHTHFQISPIITPKSKFSRFFTISPRNSLIRSNQNFLKVKTFENFFFLFKMFCKKFHNLWKRSTNWKISHWWGLSNFTKGNKNNRIIRRVKISPSICRCCYCKDVRQPKEIEMNNFKA